MDFTPYLDRIVIIIGWIIIMCVGGNLIGLLIDWALDTLAFFKSSREVDDRA